MEQLDLFADRTSAATMRPNQLNYLSSAGSCTALRPKIPECPVRDHPSEAPRIRTVRNVWKGASLSRALIMSSRFRFVADDTITHNRKTHFFIWGRGLTRRIMSLSCQTSRPHVSTTTDSPDRLQDSELAAIRVPENQPIPGLVTHPG